MENKLDQAARFKAVARQLECDDDEAKFNATVKKVAQAKRSEKSEYGDG